MSDLSNSQMLHTLLDDESLLILLFHGVVENENAFGVRNYNKKHISIQKFERSLINLLKNGGTPIDTSQMYGFLNGKLRIKKPFLVTFDDGFKNNLTIAAPILQDLGIPWILYLTEDFVMKNEMSWVDVIDSLVENTDRTNLIYDQIEYSLETVYLKINFLNYIRNKYKNQYFSYSQLINQLKLILKVTKENRVDEIDEKLTFAECCLLKNKYCVELGAHTKTHRVLGNLNADEQYEEIVSSTRFLKEITGCNPINFAYPEGHDKAFNATTLKLLEEFGYQSSPTAMEGINFRHADFFRLNRVMVI